MNITKRIGKNDLNNLNRSSLENDDIMTIVDSLKPTTRNLESLDTQTSP